MEATLEQRAKIFIEDRMAPAMTESIQTQTCQTTVVKIIHADWGYDHIFGDYGLHVEVPIPDGNRPRGGRKTFLFQDAQKIEQLMESLGAANAKELVGKQVVVYFDPRFDRYSNPAGLSAPKELEKYIHPTTESVN